MVEFLERDAGKERLFAVFLETYDRVVSELTNKIVGDLEGAGMLAIHRNGALVIRQREGLSVANIERFDSTNPWLVRLLPYLVGSSYRLVGSSYSSDTGLVFTFDYVGTLGSTASVVVGLEKYSKLGFSKDSIGVSIRPSTSD